MNRMSPKRWNRVSQVLHHALSLEESQRESFVESACAADPTLLDEIRSLWKYFDADDELDADARDTPAFWCDPTQFFRLNRRSEAPGDPIPSMIGRYAILRVLGRGAFAVVYLARDTQLDRRVALKVHRLESFENEKALDFFVHEARNAAQLDHPGIVRVYDVQRQPDLVYIVQQYIDGGDLAGYAQQHAITWPQLAELMILICQAVQYAHERRIWHRDLKPANILIDTRGGPHVADFGLALHEAAQGDRAGEVAGTPAYMSPEQVRGEAHRLDGRSDIWSLGVVLYESLAGRRPFTGETNEELFHEIQHRDPDPPCAVDPTIPPELSRICTACLAKRAADRYRSADSLIEDLRHWLDEKQFPGTPSGVVADPQPSLSPATQIKIIPKGLCSFDAGDEDFFLQLLPGPHDREGLPMRLGFWKTRIEERDPANAMPVGLMYGPSGCGKSSLVKAGLIPRLSEDVLPIYIEATVDDTEARLDRTLRRLCPEVSEHDDLPEMVAQLRKRGGSQGRKVLLILDQFEQWLHVHGADEASPLVAALRQCDGGSVQCVVMVRDDFWMSVTRFMQALEVPLLEGRNSAAVDLFERQHAIKVLTAFGRAYEQLPPLPSELTEQQSRFLQRAVDGLSDDSKVVCVRLAVFAEMMKGRPWTEESLREVGGTDGLGLRFLDETFRGTRAPPSHRAHQKAVQAVLAALLPEHGTNIRGQMRSFSQLLEVSGYKNRPADFESVLLILDNDVRLITPTERDELPSQNDDVPARQSKDYQLTHDYWVSSLREWLTRGQKETWQGRAELCLEERAAQFKQSAERRFLPSPLEYLAIQVGVRRTNRPLEQRALMRAATRYYGTITLLVLALVFAGSLALWDLNGRTQARRIVDGVFIAEPLELQEQIERLVPYRRWADRRLTPLAGDARADQKLRLRASLALLPVDADQVAYLKTRLTNCSLEEFPVLRESLRPYAPDFLNELWEELDDPELPPSQRFYSGVALAEYAPISERWKHADTELIFQQLMAADSDDQRVLASLLARISDHLVPQLKKAFRASSSNVLQISAANVLTSLAEENAQLIADLSSEATPSQYHLLAPTLVSLWKEDDALRDAFASIIKKRPESDLAEHKRVILGKRRAGAAISLVRLGDHRTLFDVFQIHGDPESLTQFVHRAADRGITPVHLLGLLDHCEERDSVLARFAILLALGEFSRAELPVNQRDKLIATLVDWYRHDPSSAIHGAAGWLLRIWNLNEEVTRVDRIAIAYDETGRREWFVQKAGEDYFTFIVFRPGTYIMGAPSSEADRNAYDTQHHVKLTRTIAVSDREVTRGQFERFKTYRVTEQYSPTDDHTMTFVSWWDAVAYCCWLTMRSDGMSGADLCYGAPTDGGNNLPFDPERPGIRLPTEAEWEFVCRSGMTTTYGFGSDRELLSRYGWFLNNEGKRAHVGRELRPNVRGLFDMHGNAFEWCHDWFSEKPFDEGDPSGPADPSGPDHGKSRSIRGGGWYTRDLGCRSANRMHNRPRNVTTRLGDSQYGFRIVMTLNDRDARRPETPKIDNRPEPK